MKTWIVVLIMAVAASWVLLDSGREELPIVVEKPSITSLPKETTVNAQIPQDDTSSNKVSSLPPIQAEAQNDHQELDPLSMQVHLAYDKISPKLVELWSAYSADTITLQECNELDLQTHTILVNSEVSELEALVLGYGHETYDLYREYDQDFIVELAHADDFIAQHVLARRLLRSVDTFEQGLYWAKIVIARGSKSATYAVGDAYYNTLRNAPGATVQAKNSAKQFRKAYRALSDYRNGKPKYKSTDINKYTDDPVATKYFSILQEIKSIRTNLGLPKFVNRSLPPYPKDISKRCSKLHNDEIMRKNQEQKKRFSY